jgi:hypothetical protein
MGAAPVSIEPATVTAAYVGALVQAANLAAQE